MPLSWNEIHLRALKFSEDWKDAKFEQADKQTFYNDFFEVFGQRRRNVSIYEQKVSKLDNSTGYIDLFWPGTLIVEHKSAGRNLQKAREQASDYFLSLKEREKPRYILLSDFQTFEFFDLEEQEEHHFTLSELPEKIRLFDFIAGYQKQKFEEQHPVNITASELMSNLHTHLEESGYVGKDLELLLVRIMFCLFADDTGIFQPDSFIRFIENHTSVDGSDIGSKLVHLFQVLDTPIENRQKTLDEDLAVFPYVNGELFADTIRTPSFNSVMREALLECCYFNWSKVSPALFGSLFQTVMLPKDQRQSGAHYTSEKNILKTVRPLFLDELRQRFEIVKEDKSTKKKSRLKQFHDELSSLTFFDPACGCGNFLILAYRELRLLEIEVLDQLFPKDRHGNREAFLEITQLSKIDVDQFYGIEIGEFPARIAETAMWLVDHQMNMRLSEVFGQVYDRLPLKKSPHIVHANSLRMDWNTVLPSSKCNYILGNPPFVGKHLMTDEQSNDLDIVFNNVSNFGSLDYVSGWYLKSAQYIYNSQIICALVSTNSIVQGEQVSILWGYLLQNYGIRIHFAHRTFKWTIDEKKAKGMNIAAVYVVIIGFAAFDTGTKFLYEYETLVSDPHKTKVSNINPYLIEADNFIINKKMRPICDVPEITYGSKPVDNGYFFFDKKEIKDFLKKEPNAKKYIRPVISAKEYLNNIPRWCLWLNGANPSDLRNLPYVLERVKLVKQFRIASKKEPTQKAAERAYEFAEIRQPNSSYIVIPMHTSENREYIPFGFFTKHWILHNSCTCIPNAKIYHFGVLSSKMHISWTKLVCGRLEGRYRYSNTLVYNNFPWPEPSRNQKEIIEEKAQAVLDERKKYPDSTLADLYDPHTMPASLLRAHQTLDKAVDKAYRKAPFSNEKARVEYLFSSYEKITQPLIYRKK